MRRHDPDRARLRLPLLGESLTQRAVDWRGLRGEAARAGGFALLGALIGAIFGATGWGAALALALGLFRQLYLLAALRAWATHPRRVELPEPEGTWGEVYERLLDLQRRNRNRKQRLAAMLAQFQASAQALPDGVVVTKDAGEIVWFNTAAQALLGFRGHGDIGQRLPNLWRHPAFVEYFERGRFDRGLELPSPVNAALMLELRVVPYGEGQRMLIIGDISNLYRLERIRRDFVANASHELRTPLTVLRGYIEMMLPEAGMQQPLGAWREPLLGMHAQAVRMEALVRDLLKLARLEGEQALARQDVLDVAQLIERALVEARALSNGRHEFIVDVDTALLLYGRDSEAESIFTNLVANAVQYSPSGGQVTVRWRSDDERGGAVFSVSDQGLGIADDAVPRLTERFYRVDEARSRASGGTGLGLSIVKHALERHEGRLEIRSRLGHGSTFVCHFPGHRAVRQRSTAAHR